MPFETDALYLRLADLPILSATRAAFTQMMIRDCVAARQKGCAHPRLAFAANGQVVAEVHRDPALYDLLTKGDYIVADGMPLVLASRLFYKKPLPERLATTDFFHDAARAAEAKKLSFYLLGGTPERNEAVAARVKELYPRLEIVGHHHGYWTEEEEQTVLTTIRTAKPDVLWVGLGFPRQEVFAVKAKEALRGIGWIVTCGGLYDHLLGIAPRAPLWMQRYGLEWLNRLFYEPRRLFLRYARTNPLAAFYLLTRSGEK